MKHNTQDAVNSQTTRRKALKAVALSGAGLSVLPSSWTKPVVNHVLLPAHAQTSVCPMLVTGNGNYSAGSAPGTCGLSFDLFSGDAAMPIDIISITNTTPVGTDMVSYPDGTAGQVTDSSGLTITWVGQAVGAPFACATAAPVPINEITFTVTYNCTADPNEQTMTFSLQEVAASL